MPDDPGHLVAVELDDGICDLDLVHRRTFSRNGLGIAAPIASGSKPAKPSSAAETTLALDRGLAGQHSGRIIWVALFLPLAGGGDALF
jgi:hypothetical protein